MCCERYQLDFPALITGRTFAALEPPPPAPGLRTTLRSRPLYSCSVQLAYSSSLSLLVIHCSRCLSSSEFPFSRSLHDVCDAHHAPPSHPRRPSALVRVHRCIGTTPGLEHSKLELDRHSPSPLSLKDIHFELRAVRHGDEQHCRSRVRQYDDPSPFGQSRRNIQLQI